MSRAPWSSWVHQLMDGLREGLCRTGAFLAMQNGFAMTAPHDVAGRPHTHSGV